jgi:hypothetical protein
MDKPESGLSWVTKLAVRDLLHDLASGRVALTHEAFQQLPSKRTATYLRDLLMQCGVLPTVDRQLLLFERWLTEHIATIENAERARLLQHFATWHPLRRRRAKTEARQQLIQAGAFLGWRDVRGCLLPHCGQADLDAWHTENYATRRPAQALLPWRMSARRMPRLSVPYQASPAAPASADRRAPTNTVH